MKNSSIYTTFSAAIAFVGALIYTVLFYFGVIPAPVLFAITGIIAALIVLTIFTWGNRPIASSGSGRCCRTSGACIVVYTAVATLFFAVLLLTLPIEVSILYTIVTFLLMFFWIFLVIMWAMILCTGSYRRDSDDDCDDTSSTSVYSNKYNY